MSSRDKDDVNIKLSGNLWNFRSGQRVKKYYKDPEDKIFDM